MMMLELAGKRLELLRYLPKPSRAFLYGGDPARKRFSEQRDAGRQLGVPVQVLIVHRADKLEGAFAEMAKQKAEGSSSTAFANTSFGPRVAGLALKQRLPTISDGVGFADQGGLLYYGPDTRGLYPRVATTSTGSCAAKPGELPIEQPSKFEFVVNLKTARAIGMSRRAECCSRSTGSWSDRL